ncbi:MAG: peptide ABC transporter substrate-binding protein, partial [Candidatus Dormibacteraceae bacterium]
GYTVQVKLVHPAGWFLSAIGYQSIVGMILDSRAVGSDPLNWWQNPQTLVGTGAYRMVQRAPKQSYDFQAVPNWWGSPKPTVKQIHLDVLADLSTGIAAYEQGRYDLVGYGGYENFPLGEVLRIRNGGGEEAKELALLPKGRSYWVSFNVKADNARLAKGPFTDDQPHAKELREAFALAIDKEKMARTVCADLVCKPATGGVIAPGLYGYLGDNTDPLAKFDPGHAKQLLQTADPDGSRTRNLTYAFDPENQLNKAAAEFLQDQWQRNLGVHVAIQPVNHSQFIPDRRAVQYVLSRDGWTVDYNYPQDWFDTNWGTALGCPVSSCSSGYASPAYDSLLAKADSEPLEKALPDYQKLGRLLSQDAVYIPLYYTDGTFLFKPYLEGAGANNFFDYYWDQIKIHQH